MPDNNILNQKKISGVLSPLFSVYSRSSAGIGDFSDLKLLIEWVSLSGNSMLQLLPMNEAGGTSCPYDSVSSFALEPAYTSLNEFAVSKNKAIAAKINSLKENFPCAKMHVDYDLKGGKMELLFEIYKLSEDKDAADLGIFKRENDYWLPDFVLYRVLKEHHAYRPWYEWEDKFRQRDKASLEAYRKEHAQEIGFYEWLQWQLFRQFKEACAYAKEKNVFLKGDLPILVSRDSADAWSHPEFFKLDFASGAPPDTYCAKGQRWGMPTYNWDAIASDGFRYLKEKLRYAENFYDILRVDHVVGLFRIWSIPYNEPAENKGLNGFFDPSDQGQWEAHGRNLLSLMKNSTKMLLCAEDLGIIPESCPRALKELCIPGNDVQRWVKDYNVSHDFLSPKDYRELSVAMLSTHDTTNWPAWWENETGTIDEDLFIRKCSDHRKIDFNAAMEKLFDPERSRHGRLRWKEGIDSADKLVVVLGRKKEELGDFIDLYLNTYQEKEKLWVQLGLKGKMREKCDSLIMRAALKISLDSASLFCINTIFDWLYISDILQGDPYQYRINTPGTVNEHNWSLTIPISLDDLLKHKVTKDIRKLIADAGRI